MMRLSSDVLAALEGRTLATAESITGGSIGAALTAVPGSSRVYRGGIISYCDEVKAAALGVDEQLLSCHGAVSAPVAAAMARGARKALMSDVAVSVTGLAGPDGDDRGNPVGTVFIGYCDSEKEFVRACVFSGDRESIRLQTVRAALETVLRENVKTKEVTDDDR